MDLKPGEKESAAGATRRNAAYRAISGGAVVDSRMRRAEGERSESEIGAGSALSLRGRIRILGEASIMETHAEHPRRYLHRARQCLARHAGQSRPAAAPSR